MGGYEDYHMFVPLIGKSATGNRHTRCENADLPGGKLIYIAIEGVERRPQLTRELGGELLVEPRSV
jgi:hypothetical protein